MFECCQILIPGRRFVKVVSRGFFTSSNSRMRLRQCEARLPRGSVARHNARPQAAIASWEEQEVSSDIHAYREFKPSRRHASLEEFRKSNLRDVRPCKHGSQGGLEKGPQRTQNARLTFVFLMRQYLLVYSRHRDCVAQATWTRIHP